MTPDWWAVHERLARTRASSRSARPGSTTTTITRRTRCSRRRSPRSSSSRTRVGKPVVCHIRDAHDDARAILRGGGRGASLGCVIHCFTGTPDDARRYAEIGCYVSFCGIVTYKTAQPLRDAVPLVPRDRLLIETDCPYLAPVPKRGKRNEPAFVVHTAEVVARAQAELRGVSRADGENDGRRVHAYRSLDCSVIRPV